MSYASLGHDTAYHGSHSRSASESRVSSDREPLNREHSDSLYDPHTRTGRPSFSRSAQNSPAMNPRIEVNVHEPEKIDLDRKFPNESAGIIPTRPRGPSGWARFLARIRTIEIALLLIGSLIVVGVNAAVIVTYNKHRDTMKIRDNAWTGHQDKWPVWPLEGMDTKPITAYLAVGSVNALVALCMVLLSFQKSFRLMQGVCTEIVTMLVTGAFFVLWVLLAVFLQYQAAGKSGHHSFVTWSCSHTGGMFSPDSFSFKNMCALSRAGRAGGWVAGAANLLIFLTIVFGLCAQRKTRGYSQVSGGAWMPKWSRGRK
ncbi:hypothetical protein EJ05DRAFT_480413 [Pseudovirgaria hyperparasitica]|uniref:Uncharacterized protein n=1 Tax=Pseudovirgaria hyperparasitica TaxID=470096 RepID=A0A6A6VU25_9PEZI|nr:uncharacterized protein EJ05DRAFT_480413 [Pseudovirgaria hyperparasitica]KAF2753399.1 hypothetical protein EJ05DRAFT_480413 [Pseudovirgaria hyperparasitica]